MLKPLEWEPERTVCRPIPVQAPVQGPEMLNFNKICLFYL